MYIYIIYIYIPISHLWDDTELAAKKGGRVRGIGQWRSAQLRRRKPRMTSCKVSRGRGSLTIHGLVSENMQKKPIFHGQKPIFHGKTHIFHGKNTMVSASDFPSTSMVSKVATLLPWSVGHVRMPLRGGDSDACGRMKSPWVKLNVINYHPPVIIIFIGGI